MAAETYDGVVFICRSCETEYPPALGECPECGDWAFTAALSPALMPVPRRAS
ncbi:hypothetical protein [Pseudonocardia sp. H11422]|uniref:hypothetical protein n=1 Tax=Pseudonocardia sp. H11422 TaxID=2835866 RepID=UPI001BDC779F|nr:hypothetical protein [Pseudonocardia sp. H11422]